MLKQNKLIEVKEKYLNLKEEYEKHVNERNSKIQQIEASINQQKMQQGQLQADLQRKTAETEDIKANLDAQLEIIDNKKKGVGKIAPRRIVSFRSNFRFIGRSSQRKNWLNR